MAAFRTATTAHPLVMPPYGPPLALQGPTGSRAPAKKQSRWSPEENALIIELRGSGMNWGNISKRLPGRSVLSCRLYYHKYLEKGSVWDEKRKDKLAILYERFKPEIWQKVAEEMALPWRAVEAMHWQLGEADMARRAGSLPPPSPLLPTQAHLPRFIKLNGEDEGPFVSLGSGERERWGGYHNDLRLATDSISSRDLVTAGKLLLNNTKWLLSSARELGLIDHLEQRSDLNYRSHPDRIRLWENFNRTWLSLLQAQKNIIKSNGLLERQSLLTEGDLQRFERKIKQFCEPFAGDFLVNCDDGVWKDRIIQALQQCIALFRDKPALTLTIDA